MKNIEEILKSGVKRAVDSLYGKKCTSKQIQIQKTKREFKGDITIVVFPLIKFSAKTPDGTANEIGEFLENSIHEIVEFNVIKGFLNLTISGQYYLKFLNSIYRNNKYGFSISRKNKIIVVEYSSPNTNKPLHLGHVRNNLLGAAVSKILDANRYKVYTTNLVNDRGIHICKSMLAWKRFGKGETPELSGLKGDKLVGKYYVLYDKKYKEEVADLVKKGIKQEEAEKQAPILLEAQEMLRKWESNDQEVVALWKMMNSWVYKGFKQTYNRLGVKFDDVYYESNTWKLGKQTVLKGLKNGIFKQHEDGSVWADLRDQGLDEKVLLRSDGTSVYITQDIGTAQKRMRKRKMDQMVYVVGNEQNYHFKVLRVVLDMLGFLWAEKLFHLSYGMVELPEGKMKSREGTVVDADDLMDEMIKTARDMSKKLGKLEGLNNNEKNNIVRIIGLGALKYFILKVDPTKNMLFDPNESIDFNGNTGPFIQYTYARIQSIFRKAAKSSIQSPSMISENISISIKEKNLLKLVHEFPAVIKDAGGTFNPSLIANYIYDLVKEYNQFYHDHSILKEENPDIRDLRLALSYVISGIVKRGMELLGIEVPERM